MNAGQKLILKICALIIMAMMIYPPYQLLGRGMGYHFVFIGADYPQATINGGLLLVQWVGVCLIGGIAYLLARAADASEHDMLSQPGIRLAVQLTMWILRAARALALIYVVIGCLGLIGDLVKLAGYDESIAADPGRVAALLLMKFVGLSAIFGVAWVLRVVINKIHSAQTGTADLLLANWRSL